MGGVCIVWNVCALSNVSNVSSIAPKPRACAQAQSTTQTTPSTTSAGGRACSARNGPNPVSNARPERVGPGLVCGSWAGRAGQWRAIGNGQCSRIEQGRTGPNAPGNTGAGAGHTGRAEPGVGPSPPSHHERATAGRARPQGRAGPGARAGRAGGRRLAAHSAPPGARTAPTPGLRPAGRVVLDTTFSFFCGGLTDARGTIL